jgi:curved DNA-binding protein CbpA
MKTKYFDPAPVTAEELKAAYRKLAMQHHPDRGGDTETMQAINNEYDSLWGRLKDIHKNQAGETYTKETSETPEQYRAIIDALLRLRMEGVEIEIIGSFVWLSGNTRAYKDGIKALGFRWSQNKAAWYLPPEGYKKLGKKQYDMDEIRAMYGGVKVGGTSGEQEKKAIAG